jgi:NADP-dependent 3-hydroxy acid dehydrogenase YdfG
VDIESESSIRQLYESAGAFDAVVSAAGQGAFGPLAELDAAGYRRGLDSKLMGQVNLVRLGMERIADSGSFTLTSGVLGERPTPGSAGVSIVNAGIDGFVRAAALELPRGIRIHAVSPPWVSETLESMGRDGAGGLPAAEVATAYVQSVEGKGTGQVIEP